MKNNEQKTVLLVEDDAAIMMVEQDLLKSLGYDVVTAKSGEEAVQVAARNDKIALVLMDINLSSGMDGTQAARQILGKRHLPVVFLTSHAEKEYVERVKTITRYGYILKNSDKFVFQSSLEMAFELFASGEALEESNRKLEALSVTDGLTGIANRRRFDEVLAKEHARHARSGDELSLVMLDIDHFKAFNDCYGHVAGDECLRQVARVIAGCVARPADLAARYGGEEFACILPETGHKGAVAIAEKIRRGILACAIPHKASNAADCVTASFGVATARCTANGSVVDIVAQADERLYRAKACGRNRVEFLAENNVAPRS